MRHYAGPDVAPIQAQNLRSRGSRCRHRHRPYWSLRVDQSGRLKAFKYGRLTRVARDEANRVARELASGQAA